MGRRFSPYEIYKIRTNPSCVLLPFVDLKILLYKFTFLFFESTTEPFTTGPVFDVTFLNKPRNLSSTCINDDKDHTFVNFSCKVSDK